MKRRIGMMLLAALIVATMLLPTSGVQAQQEEEVRCVGRTEQDAQCFAPGEEFRTDPDIPFDCDPALAPVDTPSQCTNLLTGEAFDCVITSRERGGDVGPGEPLITFTILSCVRDGPPPGDSQQGGGGGQQGGGGGQQGGGGVEITQETEQEAESGDVNQSFEVTSTGDNSNQCANAQGVSNTGNPQNVIDLLQATSEADDFEFDEVGSDITVSPESPTTCDQQVNQAASASG